MSWVTEVSLLPMLLGIGAFAAHVLAWHATRRWRWSTEGAPLLALDDTAEIDPPWVRLALIGLLASAFVFRLPGLDEGLWFDELQTWVRYARRPFAEILTAFDSRNQHMLYSLSAHASLLLFGDHAWALRLPAVLFGVASLWALYRCVRMIGGHDEALLAVALLGFSYQHVWFSQNARGYTGLLLGALLGTEVMLRMLAAADGRARTAWTYGLVMALAIVMHATAVFIVVAHAWIWAVACLRRAPQTAPASIRLPLLGFVLAATLSLLVYGPSLSGLLRTIAPARMLVTAEDLSPRTAPELPRPMPTPTYMIDEGLHGMERSRYRLQWLSNELVHRLTPGGAGAAGLLALACLPALIGTWRLAVRRRNLMAVLVLPGIVTFVALFVTDQVLFPRFFFFTVGSGVALWIHGFFVAWSHLLGPERRWAASVVLAGMVLLQIVPASRAWEPKQRFAEARAFLHAQAAPQDAIATVAMTRLPFLEYYGEPWAAVDSTEALRGLMAAHPVTWVIHTMPAQLQRRYPFLWNELQAGFETAAVFPATVGDGTVTVSVYRRAAN